MDPTRRSLLKGMGAGVAGAIGAWRGVSAAGDRFAQGRAPRAWGIQLYTVRSQIAADAASTLERIARIGYTELEVMQATLPVVAPIARRLGLSMVSVHLDGPTASGQGFDAFLPQARAYGVTDVVIPFVPPAERPDSRAGLEALAERLSSMARSAKSAGLRFCYHNHAFEFGRDRDGTRRLDVLMQQTSGAGMLLQLDVFWASVAGVDPIALLGQYKGRVASVHLKDKAAKTATSLVESEVPRTAFVEVGSGTLDFPAILRAAGDAGVGHYFVEQDFTAGDPLDSIRKSHDYLAGLRGQ